MDPSSGRGFTIIGRVIERASGSGVAGARVEAWDKDLIFDDLVGSAITDVQGRFEIPFESRAFRELLMDRRPDLYFKVFLDGTLIASTENSVLWNVAQGDTDVTIEVETVAVLPQRFVVLGHVRQADGRPLVNAPVRAFDRDLRSEQTLGEARTNAQGRYRITYGPDRFLRAEKRTADLQVRVYDAQDLVRAESSVHFNAAPRQTVNLLLGGGEFQGLSEYEQLVEEIAPLLEGLTLAQLREDDAHQDISFLSGETGRDMRSLALLARAGRAEAQTGIEAEVFFGLFRKGLPLGLPALIAAGVQAQRKALGDAVDESIISLRIASQIESIVEQLTRLVVWHALQPPADPSRANLAGLAATVLPDSAREAFIAAYAEHSGSVFEFWEQLAAQPEFTEHIQGLQLACQLGALTRSHLPLVRFLQQAMGDGVLSTGLQTIPFHSLADSGRSR